MPDKRHWTTPAQREFLLLWSSRYLDAQAQRRYNRFWPAFFQEWFTTFPESEPTDEDPTDSEFETESEAEEQGSDAGDHGESGDDGSGSKRKRASGKAKGKKRARKVNSIYFV
jgi:hypothetical protein